MFDMDTSVSISDLAVMTPSAEMGSMLAALDSDLLSRQERVIAIAAYQRMVSHYQAHMYREMDRLLTEEFTLFPDEDLGQSALAVQTEIGAALHLTNRSAEIELTRAVSLRRSSAVWKALERGEIDRYRAQVIVDNTVHLPTEAASWVVEQVIDRATGRTAPQIRTDVQRLCYMASPEFAQLRYGEAVKDRLVQVTTTENGTAMLEARDLPPDRAQAAYQRLSTLARRLKRNDETRTMDQLRADLLIDLLLGTDPAGTDPAGSVDIRVDLTTLTALSENPGELVGFGPVISDIARQVVTQQRQCRWSWTVTDPETGMPLYGGTTKRRPRAETKRKVVAFNPTCVFPGCRMPALQSDLDHRQPYSEGGLTDEENLAPLCRRHHRAKHDLGWTYLPIDHGDFLWTSPLGHRYTTSGRSP